MSGSCKSRMYYSSSTIAIILSLLVNLSSSDTWDISSLNDTLLVQGELAKLKEKLRSISLGEAMTVPSNNFRYPQKVFLRFKIGFFVGIDDPSETISFSAGLGIKWSDDRISTLGKAAGFVSIVSRIPAQSIWLPEVLQLSDPERPDLLVMRRPGMWVTVKWESPASARSQWNSTCSLWMADVYAAKCDMQAGIKWFPFDQHLCNFTWMANMYDYLVQLLPDSAMNSSNLATFLQRPEHGNMAYRHPLWEILKINILYGNSEVRHRNFITIQITAKRKPGYHVLTVFIPTIIVAILQLLAFLVPHSDEKPTLFLTILLAFWIIQSSITVNVPKVGESALLVFIGILSCVNSVFVIESMIALYTIKMSAQHKSVKVRRYLMVADILVFVIGFVATVASPIILYA